MSELFKHIGEGQFPGSREYNSLVDVVAALLRSSNVQYFTDSTGVHVRRSPAQPEPVLAYVKTTPGATTSVAVYLYADNSVVEVTVVCYIYGGGNLDDAFPTLVDGMPFYVQFNPATGVWKNVTPIFKIGVDCSG